MDRALADAGVGLGFAQSSALSIIGAAPGLHGAEVARRAMVSPQAMNAVLRELARRRLVQRRDHPASRRLDAWYLSERGRQQRLAAREVFGQVMARMLAALDDRDVAELGRLLAACAAALDAGVAAARDPSTSAAPDATAAAARPLRSRPRPSG